MNDDIKKALRPVKRRIRRNRFFRGAAAGLATGLAAAVILQTAAFFTPVPDRALWAIAVILVMLSAAALGNAVRPVKDQTAAEAADACGLKERAITAIESEGDELIRQLQRKDACAALERLDMRAIRPGSVKKALFAALGCAALLGALLVPNAQDTKVSSRKALNRVLQEGRETIAKAAEEDGEKLPDGNKNELRKITEDLNRELGNSRDAADALVALDRAEKRLEQLQQRTAGDISDVNGADGDGAGETRKAGSTEGEAAGDASAENARQTGSKTMAGATAAQMKTLQALAALKGAVSPSLHKGTQMNGRQGTQDGQNGTGAGGTSPDGKTGGGAGEGSTNEEQQGGGKKNQGILKGNRDPRFKEESYETIYDPEHIDKRRQDVMTEQNRLGEEESLQTETEPGRGNTSGDVPWGEVLQEYAETEARAADRENLTTQEREWVNEYFRLLTEQQ